MRIIRNYFYTAGYNPLNFTNAPPNRPVYLTGLRADRRRYQCNDQFDHYLLSIVRNGRYYNLW